MLFMKTKPASHEARILAHLKHAGHYGAWNYDLARQSVGGLAWHRRITDLRKEGYNISRIQVSKGSHKYFLNESNE